MKIKDGNSIDEVAGTMRTLAVLLLAIILRDYTVGAFSWAFSVIVATVIMVFYVGNMLGRWEGR